MAWYRGGSAKSVKELQNWTEFCRYREHDERVVEESKKMVVRLGGSGAGVVY